MISKSFQSGFRGELQVEETPKGKPAITVQPELIKVADRLQVRLVISNRITFRTDRLGVSLDSAHQDRKSVQKALQNAIKDAIDVIRLAITEVKAPISDTLTSEIDSRKLTVELQDSMPAAVLIDGEVRCQGVRTCSVEVGKGLHVVELRRHGFSYYPFLIRFPHGSSHYGVSMHNAGAWAMTLEAGSCRVSSDGKNERICNNGYWQDTIGISRNEYQDVMGVTSFMDTITKERAQEFCKSLGLRLSPQDSAQDATIFSLSNPTLGFRCAGLEERYWISRSGRMDDLIMDMFDGTAVRSTIRGWTMAPLESDLQLDAGATLRKSSDLIRVLRLRVPALVQVYSKYLHMRDSIQGSMMVHVIVNPSGECIQANLISSTTGSEEMDAEVLTAVSTWKMGVRPELEGNANLSFPVHFYLNQ
jgi:TonB family protein